MWTAEDVRDRFIEAVEIERIMQVKGLPMGGNGWPTYRFDDEDHAGWDDQARLDHLEAWQGRKVTKAADVTRWEQCYYIWTLRYIEKPEYRRIVWLWAKSSAFGPTFSSVCEKRGWAKSTAYARLARAFDEVTDALCNNRWPLQLAKRQAHGQNTDVSPIGERNIVACAERAPPAWRAPDAVLADSPEVRDFSWSENRASRLARKLLTSKQIATSADKPTPA